MATCETVRRRDLALCLPAIGATTPLILQRVDDALLSRRIEAHRDPVQIALAEVLNNIIEHSYGAEAFGAVAIALRICKHNLCIHVVDWGPPYPDLAVPEGALPDPTTLAEGGYGWFLIKSLVHTLRYSRRWGANHLSLGLISDAD